MLSHDERDAHIEQTQQLKQNDIDDNNEMYYQVEELEIRGDDDDELNMNSPLFKVFIFNF